jgi:hypothetical protein
MIVREVSPYRKEGLPVDNEGLNGLRIEKKVVNSVLNGSCDAYGAP